jgi:DNA repair exonuclease SbcCD ATPase subunit
MSQGKISFACPRCAKVVSTAIENAGKKGKCIGCGESIFIPRNRVDLLLLEQQQAVKGLEARGAELSQQVEESAKSLSSLNAESNTVALQIQAARLELASLEENLEDISYGIYKAHFTFQDSEQYKAAITSIRIRQKALIRSGGAATCATTWSVAGSEREGVRMTKQYQKLLLRAFNGETDAAIAKVTWSNYRVMVTRIRKAQDALNKLGAVMQMSICDEYRDLKLEELKLVFEQEEKKQKEREEQRLIKAQIREEEKVQRELARAQEEAEEEEKTYEEALAQARKEAAESIGEEREAFESRIADLQKQLEDAHEKKERAIAQAQLTKSGHVYIISNLGAFGDDVIKIGMTRRRDPQERIRELGDASVPFPFDIHAMIYSENAPELECVLHTKFWERRVNRANDRKEFFRVKLGEIEAFATAQGYKVQVTQLAEAKEYRQSLAEPTGDGVPDSCQPELATIE